jgi:hypothetical protein
MPFGDYKELLDLVECLKKDFEKFYLKGIKVSGTRIRAGLQDIKKKIQEIRIDIQKTKKTINTDHSSSIIFSCSPLRILGALPLPQMTASP